LEGQQSFSPYSFDAGTTKTLGGTSPVSFVDVEYDHRTAPFIWGYRYTADGKAFIATHR